MPEYLAPGVFVEEIDSGSKPIEGVGTNTAAFVGYAKSGECNKPIFITSWSAFCKEFGEDETSVIKALSDETGLVRAAILKARRSTRKSLLDFARNLVESEGKSWSEFVSKYKINLNPSPFLEYSYLAHAVQGYYSNGGRRAYVLRVPVKDEVDFYKELPGKSKPASSATATIGGLTLKALEAGKGGNSVTAEVTHIGDSGANTFTLKVTKDGETSEFGTEARPLTPDTAKDIIERAKSKAVAVDSVDTAVAERPRVGTFNFEGGADAQLAKLPDMSPMDEIPRMVPDEWVGDETNRTGFKALAELDDCNMICVPDLMAGLYQRVSLNGSGDGGEEVRIDERKKNQIVDAQTMLVNFCEQMGDRIAILDPVPDLSPQQMRDLYVTQRPIPCDRGHGAIYYPWIKISHTVSKDGRPERVQKLVPPCGHIAGIWCKVVDNLGVHKAPANEPIMGAVGLEWNVTRGEQEILNPEGINCLRTFPGTGIRVWGARTLATRGNPSWKYVNVRRLFDFLEKSMDRNLQWVVFEPNDEDLWGRVRRTISSFLWVQWKEGKLFGATPEEAFYVKCDYETNPQDMIDLGRMYCEIGVNPVKPAEFVIIRIGQWSGGGEVGES